MVVFSLVKSRDNSLRRCVKDGGVVENSRVGTFIYGCTWCQVQGWRKGRK